MIYLAMYKAKGNWQDKIIRFFTKGDYSHCEIFIEGVHLRVVRDEDFELSARYMPCYFAYSSSPRDGGVRCKEISIPTHTYGGEFNPENWDLISLPYDTEEQVKAYFEQTKGKKYDWWGVLGIVLGIKQKRSKFFCSEWCFNAITGSDEGWRFSPNQLAVMFTPKAK